jgi:hypothetical protein
MTWCALHLLFGRECDFMSRSEILQTLEDMQKAASIH